MRTPDCDVYVVIAQYPDRSDDPLILAVYESSDEASRLRDTILESTPTKNVWIVPALYWSAATGEE